MSAASDPRTGSEEIQPPKEQPEERYFLEGPKGRGRELSSVLKIGWELIRGFRMLHFVGPCVTVFGSARFKEDHPFYELARKGIDLIVANDVSAPGVGFEHDTIAVVILAADGAAQEIPLTDKRAVARAILDAVSNTRSNP